MTNIEGQTFAGYEVLAKLGEGGMGAVYKARPPLLNRLVALKVMSAHLGADPSFVARFVREAAAAANLNHPNMVQVYTAGEADGVHFIAMEFVEGESLQKRLHRLGRIEPREAIAITVYVAQALQYAWNKARLIHRDIKPDNIFLSNSGEVKVGDLGLAKSVGGETTELTQTGTAMGSPHYISPEQATGLKEIDFRTDIYSLGCTLYHMLTGQTPYSGDSSMIVMMKHVNDPPPAIFKVWPTCPMPLGMLVGKMLAKDRNARPQSYEQLVDDLLAVHEKIKNLESVRAVAVTPAAPQPKSATPATGAKVAARSSSPSSVEATVAARPPGNRKLIYAAAGLAAVAAIGVAAWWFADRVPSRDAAPVMEAVRQDPNTLSNEEKRTGVESLFNGTDLAGWEHAGNWTVEDGAIFLAAKGGNITYKAKPIPDDFDLRFEWKVAKGSNSGVFYGEKCEYQVVDNENHRDGRKPQTSAASLFPIFAPSRDVTRRFGEWNQGRIVRKGTVIQHWLNGEKVIDFDYVAPKWANDVESLRRSGTDLTKRSAFLRLQDHTGAVWFRRIQMRTLGSNDLIEDGSAVVATPKKPHRVLVFCRCEGFVHRDGIAAANKALEQMGKKSGAFEVDISSDYEALDAAKLASYDGIVLNNTTKLKIPDDAKKQALLDFVHSGKALIGIHAATDNFGEDPALAKLIGGIFDGHPWGANSTWAFKLDEPDHPLCRAFEGRGFKLMDEIYQLKDPYTRADRRVLLSLDLSDQATARVKGMKREDKDFAVAWIKNEGKGRVFYCALGHGPNVFEEPAVLQFYLDGIRWALGDLEADATPIATPIASATAAVTTLPSSPASATPDPAPLRYGLYLHFDITTFTGYQNMSLVGKAPPSAFTPKALDVRQWARVAREAGASFAVLTAKHEAGFCLWPAKDYDYHVGLSLVKTDIVGEFVAACKTEGIKAGVHYAVPDGHVEGKVKFREPVEAAYFEVIKKHLTELTANYPDILIYILDCAHRFSSDQFREVSNLLKQSNPQRLIFQTALNERRGRIPSIPGVQEHNAVSVNKNWFWSPNVQLTPASGLYQDYLKSAERNLPLLVNVGPDRDGRIPDEFVAVLTNLKGMMGK